MTKSIEKVVTSLVKWLMPFCLLTFIPLLSSCEEDDDDDDESEAEFENWQVRNDKVTAEWAADQSLLKFRSYALNEKATAENSDYIYVKVLEEGNGIGTPMLTDTVRIAYRGRLIPSKTYPEGFVFDQSFYHDFAWDKAYAAQGASWIVGVQSALLQMHVGDRWLIHIPYQLAYGNGTGSTTTIPAYSNLVFDVALFDFWHPEDSRPPFKVRK